MPGVTGPLERQAFSVTDRKMMPLAVWTAPSGPAVFDWPALQREAEDPKSYNFGLAQLLLAARVVGQVEAAAQQSADTGG